MAYYMALLLDEDRMNKIRGTAVEKEVTSMFGGEVNAIIMEFPDDKAKQVLNEFPTARIDSRGFLEDIPVAMKRTIFEEVSKKASAGPEVLDAVISRLDEIKELAEQESEYIPPPEI
ncbi:MAG: hypothetical protein R6U44_05570 [Archaeoglobaceae archaeon]